VKLCSGVGAAAGAVCAIETPGSANAAETAEARSSFFMVVPSLVKKMNKISTAHRVPGLFLITNSILENMPD
jgi:hypothetical protein